MCFGFVYWQKTEKKVMKEVSCPSSCHFMKWPVPQLSPVW